MTSHAATHRTTARRAVTQRAAARGPTAGVIGLCRATPCAGIMSILAATCLLWQAPPAHAQDSLSVAARLVMRQPTGVVLRLNAANKQVTGVLDRVADGAVHLSEPPQTLPLSSITDAWLQRRSTARGGKVGAIIGAGSGAALFGVGAAFLAALCESGCADWGAGEVVVATLIGGAAGAASGYIVGALIGASVPRWEALTETSAPATIVARDPRRHAGLSALSVTPVVARAASAGDDVGVGAGVSYLSQLSPHIAIGGEIARYGVATSQYEAIPCGPPEMLCTGGNGFGHMWSYGVLTRLGPGADRRLEPYGLIGLGVTNFGAVTLGSYSVGPGVRVRPGGGRFGVSAEARWHSNFTSSGDESQLGFYTFGLALSMLR